MHCAENESFLLANSLNTDQPSAGCYQPESWAYLGLTLGVVKSKIEVVAFLILSVIERIGIILDWIIFLR